MISEVKGWGRKLEALTRLDLEAEQEVVALVGNGRIKGVSVVMR